jgi:NADH pyrophosphatase NudC (nudix superfamily)
LNYCPVCAAPLRDRWIDGVVRRACTAAACDYVFWDNPVPVVAGLVCYDDQLVLARNALWPEDRYSMITGYLERHEAPDEAIVREVREELGLEAVVHGFIGHYSLRARNQLLLAYWLGATGDLTLGAEIADVRLVRRDRLDVDAIAAHFPLTARVLRDWLLALGSAT